MRQWSSLIQIMACCLLGRKMRFEPIMACCQMKHCEETLVGFNHCTIISSKKISLKLCLKKLGNLVSVSMCYISSSNKVWMYTTSTVGVITQLCRISEDGEFFASLKTSQVDFITIILSLYVNSNAIHGTSLPKHECLLSNPNGGQMTLKVTVNDPLFSIPAGRIPRCIFGAKLVVLAEIHYK